MNLDRIDTTILEMLKNDARTSFREIARKLNVSKEMVENFLVDIEQEYSDYDDSMDGDFDSAMTSAGFGTDEDYGYFGDE